MGKSTIDGPFSSSQTVSLPGRVDTKTTQQFPILEPSVIQSPSNRDFQVLFFFGILKFSKISNDIKSITQHLPLYGAPNLGGSKHGGSPRAHQTKMPWKNPKKNYLHLIFKCHISNNCYTMWGPLVMLVGLDSLQ